MARSRIVNLSNVQQFTAINLLSDPGSVGGPLVIPSCVQVGILWFLEGGRSAFNILYGRYGGGFTPSSSIADSILTTLTTGAGWTGLASFLATGTLIGGVHLRDVNSANQPVITNTVAGQAGTSASAALPNEVALCISLRTALAGRSGRGRTFIPGYATNALGAGNIVAAAARTATDTWATSNLRAAMSSNGLTWVLGLPARQEYMGATGTTHPARSATSVPITSQGTRDNHWDSQRRRGLH